MGQKVSNRVPVGTKTVEYGLDVSLLKGVPTLPSDTRIEVSLDVSEDDGVNWRHDGTCSCTIEESIVGEPMMLGLIFPQGGNTNPLFRVRIVVSALGRTFVIPNNSILERFNRVLAKVDGG